MKFEFNHALRGLEDRTPEFLKLEALQELDGEPVRLLAARVLSTEGDPKAIRLLADILRMMG